MSSGNIGVVDRVSGLDKPTSKLLSTDKERVVYDKFETKQTFWLETLLLILSKEHN